MDLSYLHIPISGDRNLELEYTCISIGESRVATTSQLRCAVIIVTDVAELFLRLAEQVS